MLPPLMFQKAGCSAPSVKPARGNILCTRMSVRANWICAEPARIRAGRLSEKRPDPAPEARFGVRKVRTFYTAVTNLLLQSCTNQLKLARFKGRSYGHSTRT